MDKQDIIIPSYAKLNLYLRVGERRQDDYHAIESIFECITLCDWLSFSPASDNQIVLSCDNPCLSCGEDNLVYRAALLLQERYCPNKGIKIHLTKHIPIGAGLGGGSSNAALTLDVLNKLWKIGLPHKALLQIAAELGSDVPFFLHKTPFAYVTGRGEKVFVLGELAKEELWHVLIFPGASLSTADVYRQYDALVKKVDLTQNKFDVKMFILALKNKDYPRLPFLLVNDLELVSMRLYPPLNQIKDSLKRNGARCVLMSGSGPTVWGLAASRQEAQLIAEAMAGLNEQWRVVVASTATEDILQQRRECHGDN